MSNKPRAESMFPRVISKIDQLLMKKIACRRQEATRDSVTREMLSLFAIVTFQ